MNPALALVSILNIPVAVLLDAWAFRSLWGWFIEPFGAPSLTLAAAAGVSLFVGFTTSHFNPATVGMNDRHSAAQIGQSWFKPLITVLVGALIHGLM